MARILVFDADAPIRNLLREVLELEGYDVVEADNAYEGIQPSQATPTDLASPDIAYLIAF
jgi:CheY-like chemotaxis protein